MRSIFKGAMRKRFLSFHSLHQVVKQGHADKSRNLVDLTVEIYWLNERWSKMYGKRRDKCYISFNTILKCCSKSMRKKTAQNDPVSMWKQFYSQRAHSWNMHKAQSHQVEFNWLQLFNVVFLPPSILFALFWNGLSVCAFYNLFLLHFFQPLFSF